MLKRALSDLGAGMALLAAALGGAVLLGWLGLGVRELYLRKGAVGVLSDVEQVGLGAAGIGAAWLLGVSVRRGVLTSGLLKLRALFHSLFARSLLSKTEIAYRLSMEKVKADKYELAGSLVAMPLDILLEGLSAGWKTGLLTLDNKGRLARIYFENGNVVGVRYDRLQDQEAFNLLYRQSKGCFLFHGGRTPPERTMHSAVLPLLRDAKRASEESAETSVHPHIGPTSFPPPGAEPRN